MVEYKNEDIFSKSVRAGRRTYFFDVRSTKAGDYYLTITESKRDFNEDGTPFYKKHKIYLYKEDFTNFKEALSTVTDFIIKEKGEEIISNKTQHTTENTAEDTTENTAEDTTEDTTEDTAEDTTEDTTEDTAEDTTEDTAEDTAEDTTTEFTEVDFDDLGEK